MIGNGNLGVDVGQCSNLLNVSQARTDPTIADVELDALIEQHRVLDWRVSIVSICINGHLRHHTDTAPK